jgi:hypothetical protein
LRGVPHLRDDEAISFSLGKQGDCFSRSCGIAMTA